ncbi:MAG: hypothetical protein LBG64_02035 [Pseudomonadales bacterium]|jgi:hypothetical protein|nr:hypothetical protein [Pseudomonadales bacterium]
MKNKNDEFLTALTKEAKAQAKLEELHLLPSGLSKASSFFWQHTWKILLVSSLLLSITLLYFSEISP